MTASFNLGKHCQVVCIGPYGRVDLSEVTEFDAKQMTSDVKVKPLNSQPRQQIVPEGWEFTIAIERANSAADDLIAQIEAGYWSGSDPNGGTIYQYISEINGTTSTYQFNGITLKLGEGGRWKSDESVKQSITGWASQRKKVS